MQEDARSKCPLDPLFDTVKSRATGSLNCKRPIYGIFYSHKNNEKALYI